MIDVTSIFGRQQRFFPLFLLAAAKSALSILTVRYRVLLTSLSSVLRKLTASCQVFSDWSQSGIPPACAVLQAVWHQHTQPQSSSAAADDSLGNIRRTLHHTASICCIDQLFYWLVWLSMCCNICRILWRVACTLIVQRHSKKFIRIVHLVMKAPNMEKW